MRVSWPSTHAVTYIKGNLEVSRLFAKAYNLRYAHLLDNLSHVSRLGAARFER